MLLSAVNVLVAAQSSSEIPEGLMNNPVLSSQLRLGLTNGLYPSGFPTKTRYALHLSPVPYRTLQIVVLLTKTHKTQLNFRLMYLKLEYIGCWSQTRVGRLSPAQTVKVNSRLLMQYQYWQAMLATSAWGFFNLRQTGLGRRGIRDGKEEAAFLVFRIIDGTYLCHSVQFVINLRAVPWRSAYLGSVTRNKLVICVVLCTVCV